MKLTWFGGTALRLHIGGEIIVVDAEAEDAGINGVELLAGADRIVTLGQGLEVAGSDWRPRPPARPLEDDAPAPVACVLLAEGCLAIDAPGERPLLIADRSLPALGRWAEKSVVVVTSLEAVEGVNALLERFQPRLIALALDDEASEAVFAAIAPNLDETGLVVLERRLAVEV